MLDRMMKLEKLIMAVIAAGLLAAAGAVVVLTVWDAATSGHSALSRILDGLEGLLLAVVILEIQVTVVAHLRGAPLQLENFLIAGAVAGVRHILMIGAYSTAAGPAETREKLLDLAVNAGVILALVVALVLLWWGGRWKTCTSRRLDCE